VKYEDVYLHGYENGREARARLARYIAFYNVERAHQAHDYRTPDEIHGATAVPTPRAAA